MRYFYLVFTITFFSLDAFAQAPNPDVAIDSCPYNIIFVMDESGSISGPRQVIVETGAKNLVAGMAGAGTRMAVVEFDCAARRASIGGSTAYQVVDNTFITNFNTYINGGGSTGNTGTYSPGGGTDWADALNLVATINAGAPPNSGRSDLVIFFTDGDPTCSSGWIAAANSVKAAGSHIFVIGVTPGGAGISNIEDITGSDRYTPGSIGSFLGYDYVLEPSFVTPQCR